MSDDNRGPSRRTVLKSATATASGLALAGSASADHGSYDEYDSDEDYEKGMVCDYPNPAFGKGFVFPEHFDACAADHPEARRLKEACRYSLDNLYPDLPTLIGQGFIPYFDIVSVGGFSHWLHPGHINDHNVNMDPGRPETILVNNNTYCAQGVMFIPDQEKAGREPPVYATGSPDDYNHEFIYPKRERQSRENNGGTADIADHYTYGDKEYANSGPEGQGYYEEYEGKEFDVEAYEDGSTICAPWHRHTDGASRFAWWYNRQLHEGALLEDEEAQFWCVVPAMFHVWPGAPEDDIAVFEHDAPSNQRTDESVCRGGYEDVYTPAGGGELTLEDLPESVQQRAMPADLERELEILSDFDDATLYQMTIGEIKRLVR